MESIPLPEVRIAGLSSREKQELRRIEGVVHQLKSLGVTAIPSELLEQRDDLASRDVPATEPSEATKMLPELDALADQLEGLCRRIRCLRNEIRSHTPSSGSRAYYPVELSDLIHSGLLSTNDRLELQWSATSAVFEGRLEADGRILANTPQEGWKSFPSLSSAAQFISGRSQNGWEHWRKVNEDGTRTQLKTIREHYQEERSDA